MNMLNSIGNTPPKINTLSQPHCGIIQAAKKPPPAAPRSFLHGATAALEDVLQDNNEELIDARMQALLSEQYNEMLDALLAGRPIELVPLAFPKLSDSETVH